MKTLYELSAAYAQVLELVEEGESEALKDTLESIQEPLEDKAENIAKLIQSINADCEVIKNEEKRLADRRKTLENKAASLKQYLFEQLEFAGIGKVKRPTVTISVQNNPQSVDVVDDSLIPEGYWIVPDPVPTLDKKTIMKILKEGQEIPGVALKQGRGLRIK